MCAGRSIFVVLLCRDMSGEVACFVLTLEATMSGEVHSRCSRMLDYERASS